MSSPPATSDDAVALFETMHCAMQCPPVREELLMSDNPANHVCTVFTCPHLRSEGDARLDCTVTGQGYGL